MNKTTHIEELAGTLKRLPHTPAASLADKSEVSLCIDNPDIVHKTFAMLGYKVQRIKFLTVNHKARGKSAKYPRYCKPKKDLDQKIDNAIGNRPGLKMEQQVMANILLETGRVLKKVGLKKREWSSLSYEALERLWIDRDLAQQVEADIAAGKVLSEDSMALLAKVKGGFTKQGHNPCYQYQRDMFTGNNSEVLTIVKDIEIFIAVDQNNAVLVFVFGEAVQHLFSERVVQDVMESTKKWAYIQDIPRKTKDVRHRI